MNSQHVDCFYLKRKRVLSMNLILISNDWSVKLSTGTNGYDIFHKELYHTTRYSITECLTYIRTISFTT